VESNKEFELTPSIKVTIVPIEHMRDMLDSIQGELKELDA
jgi:hypothetical protein